MSTNNKRGYAVSMYRSPCQTSDDFNSFTTNLEKLVVNISSTNPHFILMIGDFNAKSSNWSSNDTTTAEGAQLVYLTSLYGMKQVITKPTHILEESSSYIDLIFSNQPNLIIDSGVHPTLHSKFHDQIIYTKINLKIEYPSPYSPKIWNYSRSETELTALFKVSIGQNYSQRKMLMNKLSCLIKHY